MTKSKQNKFLVVGAGNMGGALLSGWIKGRKPFISPDQLIILDPNPGDAAKRAVENGAIHLKKASSAVNVADFVLMSTKPQIFDEVARTFTAQLKPDALILSVMAGPTLGQLEKVFPHQRHIRAMPNTPVAIGEGITAFICGEGVSATQKSIAKKLLSSGGKVAEVSSENLIDVVTAVSGSGPAYVFHVTEALEVAALEAGMPSDLAPLFARQTVVGAGLLLKKDNRSAKDLREAVTSPNGTTEAALDVLMGNGALAHLMRETVAAALKRSRELGNKS